jgi:hypothetical protein
MILLQQEGEVEHYSIEILDANRWLIKIPTSFRIEQASSSTMTSSCTAAAVLLHKSSKLLYRSSGLPFFHVGFSPMDVARGTQMANRQALYCNILPLRPTHTHT